LFLVQGVAEKDLTGTGRKEMILLWKAAERSGREVVRVNHLSKDTAAMTSADEYRIKAGDLVAFARAEPDPFQRAEYERLSAFYLRLAEQAERNSLTDVVYETSPDQPQAQQQQQAQPEKKDLG
jgi:hypothetical protein